MAKRLLDTLIGEPWEELVKRAEGIENDFLGNNLKIPVKTVTSFTDAQTYQKRVSSLPQELEAFESSPNGDCLYNSVSKVLYGDEYAANRLRLAAVVDGVKNCKKYIKQHITDRNNVPEMIQFMHSVLTDESLNKLDSSRSEDLEYLGQFLIHNAVLETIKPGAYSSSIQVLFLSNAIGYRIRQYYEDEIRPKDDVLPLFGVENVEECIILLWVKGDGSPTTLNHIVPVLPKAKLVTTSVIEGTEEQRSKTSSRTETYPRTAESTVVTSGTEEPVHQTNTVVIAVIIAGIVLVLTVVLVKGLKRRVESHGSYNTTEGTPLGSETSL